MLVSKKSITISRFITGEETVERLNMILLKDTEKDTKEEFYDILQRPCLQISHCIDKFAVPLYYEEMKEDRSDSQVK